MRFPALLALALASHFALAAPERPNIIFILADDLGMGDLGCYGQRLIQTPNLDRMAAEGTRFTRAYCGTSVCAPSRASLLTGLHSGHSPIRSNWEFKPREGQLPLPANTPTVAGILRRSGYATACIGKWGLGMFDTSGSPLKKGFDHFYGYNCQRHAHSYFPTHLYDGTRRFELPGNDGKGVGATYAQDLIQNEVERWVRSAKDRPFFLYYAVTLPHHPAEIDRVGAYAQSGWTPAQQAFAAQVTRLDTDVGRLLDLLAELRIDSRTLVMLAGDNGPGYPPDSDIGSRFDPTLGGRFRGIKRSLYEGALRQPAIARWPGVVPAGRATDEAWAFWDFLPTAAELARAPMPEGFRPDGLSLAQFLKGGSAPRRDYFYWELHEGASIQAAAFDRWKAVRNGPARPVELYDLESDLAERTDRASEHPEIVERARRIFAEARTEIPEWPMVANPKERAAARKNAGLTRD
jgi:arylsulfatase A-like enzyme